MHKMPPDWQADLELYDFAVERFQQWQQEQHNTVPPKLGKWFLIASLALFVAAFATPFSWKPDSGLVGIVILVGVLFLHEIGHLLAMRYFGYQNTSIFFLPFFGAAASGHKHDATLVQKVWVLLAGPLPGIILGLIIAIAISKNSFSAPSWLLETSVMLIVVNLLNLLPVYPLDGGKITSLLLCRYPYAEVLCKGCAVILLLWFGRTDFALLFIGLLIGVTIPGSLRYARLYKKLHKALRLSNISSDRLLHAIFKVLYESEYEPLILKREELVKQLFERYQNAAKKTTLALLAVLYGTSLLGSIAASYQIYALSWQQFKESQSSFHAIWQKNQAVYYQRIKEADRALSLNPDDPAALHKRGEARFELFEPSEYKAAMRDYDLILRSNPNDNLAYRQRGEIRYRINDLQGAIQDYNRALRLYPHDVETYSLRGKARAKLGDFKGAIEDYEQGIRIAYYDDNNGIIDDYLNAYMDLHGNKSSLENLRQNYDRALNSNPRNVDAYWRRGEARYLLNDLPGALADYNQALQLRPEAKGYLKRAFVYMQQHNFQGALQDYNSALQLNPGDTDIYLSRARVRRDYQVRDYQEAIEDYKRVLSLQPEAVGIYSILGEIQYINSNRQKAIVDYSKVIRFNPNDWQAYHSRAQLYFQLGNYHNAIQDFNQALRFEPVVYSQDYVQRGISRHQLGDYKGAIDDFDRYIAAYKDLPTSSTFLWRGVSWYKLDNYQNALSDFNKAIQEYPQDASYYFWRAKTKYQLGDYKGAIADSTTAIRLDPKFTEIKDAYSLRRQAQQRLDKQKHLPIKNPQK